MVLQYCCELQGFPRKHDRHDPAGVMRKVHDAWGKTHESA